VEGAFRVYKVGAKLVLFLDFANFQCFFKTKNLAYCGAGKTGTDCFSFE
jgi:hypothetical protein